MKTRFIQTKQSGYGEWVAEVDPTTIKSIAFGFQPTLDGIESDISDIQHSLRALCEHFTTIDMEGRTGIEAENAAKMFEEKGFTVINLGDEI